MVDKHPDQAEIAEYLAGLMDGDGWMTAEIKRSETSNVGHIISTRVGYEFYVAGLFDAEGSIDCKIHKHQTSAINYQHTPRVLFSMINKEAEDLKSRFLNYFDELGVEYNLSRREMPDPNHRDQWKVRINKIDSVHTILAELRPYLLLKQRQAGIMVDEIIPRIRREEHTEKRGFLAVAAWRDVMNEMKGGLRGDYNLLYFEDLWDMQIDLQKHGLPADLRERIEEG